MSTLAEKTARLEANYAESLKTIDELTARAAEAEEKVRQLTDQNKDLSRRLGESAVEYLPTRYSSCPDVISVRQMKSILDRYDAYAQRSYHIPCVAV